MKAIQQSFWSRFLRHLALRLRWGAHFRRLHRRGMSRLRVRLLELQACEERVVPATLTWDGGAGTVNWSDANNWDTNALPAAGDDVVIPNLGGAGADVTITQNQGTTIKSLTTSENLLLAGGGISLTFTGDSTVLALNNGANVSLPSSSLDFSASSAAYNQLVTSDSTGTITLNQSELRQLGTAHTVTFGSGVTVRGVGVVGAMTGATVAGTWSNAGTVSSNVNGGTITLAALSTFQNQTGGVLEAKTGTTLAINGTVNNSGRTLVLTGPGTYVLAGTINGGTIQGDATNILTTADDSATLDGVTISAGTTVRIPAGSYPLIVNGLTVHGRLEIDTAGSLTGPNFVGTQTLSGTGEVVFLGTGSVNSSRGIGLRGVNTVLTIAPGLTVRLGTGQFLNGIGGVNTSVINQGTIEASNAGAFLIATDNFNNAPGGVLRLNNAGLTATISSTTWSNQGTIELAAGILNLGGTFAGTGSVNRTGGTLNLTGTLSNNSGTLDLNQTGPVTLAANATLVGVTILGNATNKLTTAGGSPNLDGVTIAAGATVRVSPDSLPLITNGLTVAGRMEIDTAVFNTGPNFVGTQTLGGTGEVVFLGSGASSTARGIGLRGPNTVLTIAPGLTIRIGTGQFVNGTNGVNTSVINQGTIEASNAGSFLIVSDNFTNASGGVLRINNSGMTATIASPLWSNQGTIELLAGTLSLGGSFSSVGLGTINRTGGILNLTGTINSAGQTLDLTETGPATLSGTIIGGSIQGNAANVLTVSGINAVLNGVTLAPGTILRIPSGATATITNGLTVNGRVEFTSLNSGYLDVQGTQTVGGSGMIEFMATGGISSNTSGIRFSQPNMSLTLGPNLTVRGGVGTFKPIPNTGSIFNTTLVNQGTIEGTAAVASELLINADTFTNTGTVRVAGALQSININPGAGSWSNTGTFTLSAGTLILDGNTTTAGVGTVNRTGGTVDLRGLIDNSLTTLNLAGAGGLGPVIMSSNATIRNGTVAGDTTNTLTISGLSATLDGVTVNADIYFDSGLAQVLVENDLTLNGTMFLRGVVNFRSATTAANQRLRTTTGALVQMTSTSGPHVHMSQSLVSGVAQGHTVTIGSGVTVTGTGFADYIGNTTGALGTWVNEGTIQASGSLTLTAGNTFVNAPGAVWRTITGGTLTLSGAWTNDGTIDVNGGALSLGNTFTTEDLGAFTRTGGTVNLTGTLDNTGKILLLDGGPGGIGSLNLSGSTSSIIGGTVTTINGAKLLAGSTVTARLNGVSLSAGSVFETSGTIKITNGLTVAGLITLLDGGSSRGLEFEGGSQTLGGDGEIRFTGATTQDLQLSANNMTLTIGPDLTLRGGGGDIVRGSVTNANVRLEGTLLLDAAGTFNINPSSFTIAPTGEVVVNHASATLVLPVDPWTNEGAITLTSGTLTTGNVSNNPAGNSWTNPGTITHTGGTLNLGGRFTMAEMTGYTRTGGTVNLTGTIVGGLTLDSNLGTWRMAGGAIDGGAFFAAANSSAQLQVVSTSAPFSSLRNGVTLNSPIDMSSVTNARLNVLGGLTLNNIVQPLGSSVPSAFGILSFDGNQTIGGTGTLRVFNGNVWSQAAGQELTIGPNILIEARAGQIGFDQARLFNQGTIRAAKLSSLTGLSVTVALGSVNGSGQPTGSGGNSGVIEARDASVLSINGAGWTNSGTISASNSTLNFNGLTEPLTWSNTGTIAVTNATLNLGGTFTQAGLGNVVRSGGIINLTGTITGGLTLTDALGDIVVNAGRLLGGTFAVTPGSSARLQGTAQTGNELDGVILTSPVDMSSNSDMRFDVLNGLTLNTSQPIGNAAGTTVGTLRFVGTQTLRTDGGGQIVFGGHGSSSISQQNANQTLTVAPGVVIRGQRGRIGESSGFSRLVNQGTILSENVGSIIDIYFGPNGRNEGTISGTGVNNMLRLSGTSNAWTNLGTISQIRGTLNTGFYAADRLINLGVMNVTDSTVNITGFIRQAELGVFNRNRGSVTLNGTLSGGLTLDNVTGSWNLGNGLTVQGGVIYTSGSARAVATGVAMTFNGVTINGEVDLASRFGLQVTIQNGLTVNATVAVGDDDTDALIKVSGSQTIGGNGSLVFGSYVGTGIQGNTGNEALTIGAGVTLRGHTLSVTSLASLTNLGTIAADVPGGVVALTPITFNSLGMIRATNGGELRVQSASFTNFTDTVTTSNRMSATLTGGKWHVGPGSVLRFHPGNVSNRAYQIVRLNANLTLDGVGSNVFGGTAGGSFSTLDPLSTITEIGADGHLTITSGRTFITHGDLSTAGNITVGPGAFLNPISTLVSRWSGEGSPTDAALRNNGGLTGNVTYTAGQNGQAFLFPGGSGSPADGELVIPDAPTLRSMQFTLSAWVNPIAFGNSAIIMGKVTNTTLSDGGFALFLNGSSGRPGFYVNGASAAIISTTPLPLNTWSHLLASYDGQQMRLYVDGVEIGSQAYTSAITKIDQDLYIGNKFNYPFHGAIDDATYFNRGLTPAEAAALTPGGAELTQTAGTIEVTNGGTVLSTNGAALNDTLSLQGGKLTGTGTINADVVNNSVITPGASPGFLDITGDYTQLPAGVLEIEIAGRDENIPEFDRLRVTGTATLDGTVRVVRLDEFEPAPGDAFRVLTAAARTGEFATREIPAPGGPARELATVYDATGLTLLTQRVPPVTLDYVTSANQIQAFVDGFVSDAGGNVYSIGNVTPADGQLDLDTTRSYADNRDLFTAVNGSTGFVAKFDDTGALTWVRQLAPTVAATHAGFDAIAVDERGNTNPADDRIFLSGRLDDQTSFAGGAPIATPTGRSEGVILRLDPTGSLIDQAFLTSQNAVSNVSIKKLAIGPAGDVLAGTHLSGLVDFNPGAGSFILDGNLGQPVFVQLDPNLDFVRAGQLTGATASIRDIGVDSTNAVWITGTFQGTFTGLATLSATSQDVFLIKLVGSGTGFTASVANSYGDVGTNWVYGLTIDPDDNVVIAGDFQFNVDFDTAPERAFTLVSAGSVDGFVLKLAGDGAFRWARSFGGFGIDAAADVATDAAGNVYAVGVFEDTVDFDPMDGAFYLSAPPVSNTGGFAVKLDAAGRFGWATTLGDLGGVSGNSESYFDHVDVDDAGVVRILGGANDVLDFDPGAGIYAPPGTPSADYWSYLWSLGQKAAPLATLVGVPATPVKEGAALALGVNVIDADSSFFTYRWSVTRDGVDFAAGSGRALGLYLGDQGTYQVTATVTDETGNAATATATIVATNAAPVLHAATFAAPTVAASPVAAGDQLGTVIAVGNGYVLIGAPFQDVGGQPNAGGVVQLQTPGGATFNLVPPSPAANMQFGNAVAIVGNLALVGAPGAGVGGSVYVYDLVSHALLRTITGPGAAAGDRFGTALGGFGNLLAIGAPGRGSNAGTAYLFDPATGNLVQQFDNPTPLSGDEFGTALVAVGGNLLIGAPGDDTAGVDAGVAYVFDAGTGRAILEVFSPNTSFTGGRFGSALTATGLRAAIAAPFDDYTAFDVNDNVLRTVSAGGGVYVFDFDAGAPQFGMNLATLRNPRIDPNNPLNVNAGFFGASLAAAGNRLLIGATGDGQTTGNSGTAFLFDIDPSSSKFSTAVATLKKASPAANDRFGSAVAFVGDDVFVGAPFDDTDSADGGRVYRFAVSGFAILSTSTVVENGTLTLTGGFGDAGVNDAHTVLVDWGDGSPATVLPLAAGNATFSASHQYLDDAPSGTAADPKTVTVRVLDDTGDLLAVTANRLDRLDGATTTELGTFVVASTGGLSAPSAVTVGPNGDIYVSNGVAGANPVLRFSGATGAFVGTFISAGAQGTTKASDLLFGPDGHLYYADAAGNRVLRFHGQTGAFLNSYAISDPRGLAFGPDGSLYAASFAADAILRFDGTTVTPFVAVTDPIDLAFADDGYLYVLSMTANEAVRRFDALTAADMGTLANPPLTSAVGYLQTGSIYVGDPAGGLFRYSTETGELIAQSARAAGPLARLRPMDESATNVTIANDAPKVTVVAAPNSTAGQYSLRAVVNDAGTLDTHTYSWSITGGSAVGPTNNSTFSFTPTAAGVSVLLTVTDDDTGTVTSRTQVVIGTGGPDAITVNNANVIVNGVTTAYASGTNKVVVYGLAGSDSISGASATTMPMELIGGFGADTLTGGAQGDLLTGNNPGDYALADPYTGDTSNDSLTGNAGNDTLDGGLGSDTMAGGTGGDTYAEVPGSADLLSEVGGDGTDTITYSRAFSGITFSLAAVDVPQVVNPSTPPVAQHTVEIEGQFENLIGSEFDDRFTGNEINNLIDGGRGNDVIFGGDLLNTLTGALGDGQDSLAGGAGNDTVSGGSGNDIIFGGDLLTTLPGGTGPGGSDDDSLHGGTGNDTLSGGAGNDVIFGGDLLTTLPGGSSPIPGAVSEDDSIQGGAGNDTVSGGAGNDLIFGGDLISTLPGATGPGPLPPPPDDDDSLQGGYGNDTVSGGSGNDVIFGGDLISTLPGAPPPPPSPIPAGDDDSLEGGAGNDTVNGGAGNDVIFGGGPFSTLKGGAGNDSSPTRPPNDDDSLTGGGGNDTVSGGSGNDIVFGGDLVSILPGGPVTDPDTGDDSLDGGLGNDTINGGAGNDVIFGGDLLSTLPAGSSGDEDDDSIGGGLGNDTVSGGSGNDVIFGGDLLPALPGTPTPNPTANDGDDSLTGGHGNDTVHGGNGNDIIFGGDLLTTLPAGAQDDDSLEGGAGNDTVSGGAGNDVIFGGDLLTTLPGGASPGDGADSLSGGAGNDTLSGGSGNDIIYGGEGDDALSGGVGVDTFEGGSGNDRIVDSTDADVTLGVTTLTIGAVVELFYDIEQASLSSGAASNRLDASVFLGPVSLFGGGGNDTLVGTAFGDQLVGSDGDDSVLGGAGADALDLGAGIDFADGGADNDVYIAPLEAPAGESLQDSDGIDGIDISASRQAANADLAAGVIQDASGNRLFLIGAFENLRGTSFNDVIKGSAERNILEGFGGRDVLDGGGDSDTIHGGFPQVVYLDFDTGTGKFEKVYSVEERNLIQANLERTFAAPFNVVFTQTAPAIARFSAVVMNAGAAGENEALIAGLAYEVDWRNYNAASRADINVNGFLGRPGQPAASSDNYVAITTTVGAHELGHLLGLRHTDAFGPIGVNPATGLPYGLFAGVAAPRTAPSEALAGFNQGAVGTPGAAQYVLKHSPVLLAPVQLAGNPGPSAVTPPAGVIFEGPTQVATFTIAAAGNLVVTPNARVVGGLLNAETGELTLQWATIPAASSMSISYQYDPFRPGYRGPDDAFETVRHLMASPASVGTSLADALSGVHLGERELVKLAFADAGVTRTESAVLPLAMPLPPAMAGILPPGQLPRNLGDMKSLAVPNLLPAGSSNAGKIINARAAAVVGSIDMSSVNGRSENDVYAFQGQAGEFLNVETLSVTIRQRIANTIDSIVRVYGPDGQPLNFYGQPAVNDDGIDNQDALLQDVLLPVTGTYYIVVDTFANSPAQDTDTGGYELFVYTYAPLTANVSIGGGDSMVGGTGSDVLVGSAGRDQFVGDPAQDTYIGATPDDVQTGVLTIGPTATVTLDASNPLRTDVLTATAVGSDLDGDNVAFSYVWALDGAIVAGATGSTLDLAATNAQSGQIVSVIATPSADGEEGDPAFASVRVENSTPTALGQAVVVTEDTPIAIVATASDLDGDTLKIVVTQMPAHGSLTIDSTGLFFVYSPDANYVGPDQFSYRVSDGVANSAETGVAITVTPSNDAPTIAIVNTTVATVEDTLTSVPGISVADVDAAELTVTLSAAHGILNVLTVVPGGLTAAAVTGNGSGNLALTGTIAALNLTLATLQYQANADFAGADSVVVVVNDLGATGAGGPRTSTATIGVAVAAINDAPVANTLALATEEDTPFFGQLPAVDPDGPFANYTMTAFPLHGTVSLESSNGSFVYTPAANYFGPDSFAFRISDGQLTSAVAAVSISVTAVGDAPTATAGSATGLEDSPGITGTATATDVDSPPGSLTFSLVPGSAVNGAVTLNPNGTYTFVPASNFFGSASFQFTASDGATTSLPATISVNVTAVNDAPSFTAGPSVTVVEDAGPQTINWATNLGAGPNETTQTIAFTLANDNGNLFLVAPTISATGVLTFTPKANLNGSATVTVQLTDNGGTTNGGVNTSSQQTFIIAVQAVNDAPIATTGSSATLEDVPVDIELWTLVSDLETPHALLSFTVGNALNGAVELLADGHTARFTPASSFSGAASFTCSVTDLADGTSPAITVGSVSINVSVAAANDPPTLDPIANVSIVDTAGVQTIALTGITSGDPNEVQTLNVTATSSNTAVIPHPAVAYTSPDSTGALSFSPVAGAPGTATITVFISDGAAVFERQFNVTVTVANTAPTASDGAANGPEDSLLTIDLRPFVSDAETADAGLTFAVSAPAQGTLTPTAQPGVYDYAPAADFNGTDSFSFQVGDGALTSILATFSITVTDVNDAPMPGSDAAAVDEDGLVDIDVLANDSVGPANETGQTLSVVSVTPAAHGVVTINGDGTIRYVPEINFHGSDSFTYTVQDDGTTNGVGDPKFATATVNISVNPVNDVPVALNGAANVAEDSAFMIDLRPLVSDPETADTELTYTVTAPVHGTLTPTTTAGVYNYAPAANYNGPDSIQFQASDSTTTSNTATFAINVTSVDDTPAVVDGSAATAEDAPLVVDLRPLAADIDTPLSALSFSVSVPANGVLNPTTTVGVYNYAPDANYNGTDSFQFQVSDGTTTSNSANFVVAVSEINDSPSAVNDSYFVAEDGALNANVRANDTAGPGNESGQTLTVVAVTPAAHGTVSINPDGTVRYVPAANFHGADTFTYTVEDNGTTNGSADSKSATATMTINVTPVNDAPTATVTFSNASPRTNEVLIATATSDDIDGDGVSLTYVWKVDGAVVRTTAGTAALTDVLDLGTFGNSGQSVVVEVTPFDGTATGPTATATAVIGNTSPTIDVDQSTVTVSEGQSAASSGTYGDADVSDTVNVTASIGTLTFGAGVWSWSLATADGPDQSQSVTVTIVDGHGGSANTSFVLNVNNAAPTVSVDVATVTVSEGQAAANSGTFADSGTDTVTLTASIGTVTQLAGAWSWTLATSDGPTQNQTVVITATDSDGAASTATFALVVNNVPPVVQITGAPANSPEGAVIALGSNVSDVAGDTHAYAWSVTKNGTTYATGTSANLAFVPDDNGSYVVTLTVTDDDGAAGVDTRTISVDNIAPQNAAVAGPSNGIVNTTISMSAAATDPAGANDPLSYSWAVYFNGAATAYATGNGPSFAFTPNAAGAYRAVVTVDDGDGGSTQAERIVAITESSTAPTNVTVTGPATAVRGQPLTFNGSATAPSGGAALTFNWAIFKDGDATPVATGAGVTFNYTPTAAGSYVVQLTATANGASATTTHNLAVRALDIQTDPLSPGSLVLAVGGTTGRDIVLIARGLNADTLIVTVLSHVPVSGGGTQIDLTIATIRPTATGWEGSLSRTIGSVQFGLEVIHLPGSAAQIGRLAVFAQGGNDDVTILGGVQARGWLYGGLGNDRLRGGSTHDVLVGGDGDDLLVGADGRDLLIGGFGSDRLLGDAQEDILIAGYTDHDDDVWALGAIVAEWTRNDASFATRIAHLEGAAGGLNGNYRLLASAAGGNAATVHDDLMADLLTGGLGQDWFLFNADGDGNSALKDRATDMSSFEALYAEDLDFITA